MHKGPKAHEKVFNVSSHKGMQIKITVRYCFTPTTVKAQTENKCGRKVEKLEHLCTGEYKMVQLFWKRVGQLLEKSHVELSYHHQFHSYLYAQEN